MAERPREPSASARTYRLVRRIISPYQHKLSLWTERATLLATVIKGDYHDAARARSELQELAPLLTAATEDLRCEAQAAGDAVASHSLVRDLERSLRHLIDVVNEHSGLTGRHPP